MENKIVMLKTYIVTIVILLLLFAVTIGGGIFYYENKIDTLENAINEKTNPGDIKIVQNVDTSVNNVIAK